MFGQCFSSALVSKYPLLQRHRNASETSGMNSAKRQPPWPSPPSLQTSATDASGATRSSHKSSPSFSKSLMLFDFNASQPHSPAADWFGNQKPIETPPPSLISPRDNNRLLVVTFLTIYFRAIIDYFTYHLISHFEYFLKFNVLRNPNALTVRFFNLKAKYKVSIIRFYSNMLLSSLFDRF